MKTSLVIAIAFIVSGAGLALLRHSSPPAAATAALTVAAPAQGVVGKRMPSTRPSYIGSDEQASARMPSQRRQVPPGRKTTAGTPPAEPVNPYSLPPEVLGIDPQEFVPMAREALGYVGTDSQADDFWALAINDPDLSADDRSNLIEDLNEAGFSDPNHVTSADLPLIQNRMALIEVLSLDAMDDTNAAAFEEAYQDLARMRDDLQPQASSERTVQFDVR